MKKQMLNLGKALNKVEQKSIIGGKIVGMGCCKWETNNFGDFECVEWESMAHECSITPKP